VCIVASATSTSLKVGRSTPLIMLWQMSVAKQWHPPGRLRLPQAIFAMQAILLLKSRSLQEHRTFGRPGLAMTTTDRSYVYLCAPVNALVEGIYEEKIPFSEVRKHGDFGLGTFDQLDGEMIMLDDQIFQIRADGRVHEVDEDALTPFACVTFFMPEKRAVLDGDRDYEDFLAWLEDLLPSRNMFYAMRIDGAFSYIKTRSVPKQECYRPLVEVAAEQPVFEFEEISGTLAGFYTPAFMASLSVPGMHLHFLSADQQHGGHLLECQPRQAEVCVQLLCRMELSLPMSDAYLEWDFRRDINQDLEQAEK
jgi:acetolactate decarboxylase